MDTEKFNHKLKEWILSRKSSSHQLNLALEYAVDGKGKRVRPRLIFETSNALGIDSEKVFPLAVAVECVHLFSLIHDDLPCLDNDDFRRGQPTLHKKFNEAIALLTGDTLLSMGWECFGQFLIHQIPFKNQAQALSLFGKSLGEQGLMGGQSLELESQNPNAVTLQTIQDQKTGSLFSISIVMPYLTRESSSKDEIEDVQKFASAFGRLYQLKDDLEDLEQDLATGTSKNLRQVNDSIQRIAQPLIQELKTHVLYRILHPARHLAESIENSVNSL